ncbi:MAG: cyclase family protein, partial [Gemmatimonadaceae bacterium]
MALRDLSMALRDISISLRPGTPEWPGDTPYDCRWTWQLSAGASVNVSAFSCSPHVGTHADAPLHVAEGAPAAHELPLAAFAGRARVADVRHVTGAIGFSELGLDAQVASVPRLLLRTGRTIAEGAFPAEWPVLSPECLQRLSALGLQLVGVDCPSVDARESTDLSMHHAIFGAGAYIVENLDLRDVEAGEYELLALPLKLEGLDAAP